MNAPQVHPTILSGPYGTEFEAHHADKLDGALADPSAILSHQGLQLATQHVAQSYLDGQARVMPTNTFGARWLLGRGNDQVYRQVIAKQAALLRETIGRNNIHGVRVVASLGPADDCYSPDKAPSINEARHFHGHQLEAAKAAGIRTAWFETIPTLEEGLGAALAAKDKQMASVISFTLQEDGRIRDGKELADAIQIIDGLTGKRRPVGYSLNCCTMNSLEPALKDAPKGRVLAIYPNAAEEDAASLDNSKGVVRVTDSVRNALYLYHLAQRFGIKIIGGCCGHEPADVETMAIVTKMELSRHTHSRT